MSAVKQIIKTITGYLVSPVILSLILVLALGAAAIIDFYILDLARRTFVFYTVNKGTVVVEDRMLKRADTKEGDIIRYSEETLLGPVSPGVLPLFPKGTKLLSLLLRDGVVYANFSLDAEMPPLEGGTTVGNFQAFYNGILRNFRYVNDVRFFIEGNAVYTEGFAR